MRHSDYLINKHKTLVVIGAGGHGLVVADCAEQIACYEKIIFLDDCTTKQINHVQWTIAGPCNDWAKYQNNADFIIAIGNNQTRASMQQQLTSAQANIVTLIHPSASISPHSKIGAGVVIFANAVVNIGAEINDGCIINTGATIDHDCQLESFCHISPGVNIAGGVKVGTMSWLGIGSTVIECINIANNTQAGAGALITASTQSNTLYLGVPAKAVRSLI